MDESRKAVLVDLEKREFDFSFDVCLHSYEGEKIICSNVYEYDWFFTKSVLELDLKRSYMDVRCKVSFPDREYVKYLATDIVKVSREYGYMDEMTITVNRPVLTKQKTKMISEARAAWVSYLESEDVMEKTANTLGDFSW